MLRRSAPSPDAHHVFAEPTPLGLIGLALGCAALTPIAFGKCLTPGGFETAGMFCLLFGAGCQLLAGLASLANRNLYGGTLFTAFSFYWLLNYWVLHTLSEGLLAAAQGGAPTALPDHGVLFATDVVALLLFAVFTYGFGFYSKLLFAFLLDIDLLFACKVAKGIVGSTAFDVPIALFTVGLGAIALFIAFAMLINPVAGRVVFPVAGPLFRPAPPPPGFDDSLREAILRVLYRHWQTNAFAPMPLSALAEAAGQASAAGLLPDLAYLQERGGVALTGAGDAVESARITASGIDLYEEHRLGR